MHTVKLPFLKLFLKYFGNISIQLYPLESNQWLSVLCFLWNLGLVAFGSYRIYQFQLVTFESLIVKTFREKPLLALLHTAANRYIYPIAFLLNSFYFLALSVVHSPLLRLLDSFEIPSFTSPTKSWRLFSRMILLHVATFLAFECALFIAIVKRNRWFMVPIRLGTFFVINTNTFMAITLTEYYKFATSKSLDLIICHYETTRNADQLHYELSQLARTNAQLKRILSFPLIVVIFAYVIDILISLAFLWVKNMSGLDTYLCQFLSHMVYLAYAESRIQFQLNHLFALIKNDRLVGKVTSVQEPLDKKHSIRQLELLPVYRSSFQLQLFNLCSINWPFIFTLNLFLLNYIVLITQTSS